MWETAHRKDGESMNTWINNLRKIKLELEAQDDKVIISKRYYASKLMRGSGLSSKERAQCLWNAGGIYEPEGLISVLRTTYATIEDDDRRRGKVSPMKLKVKKTFRKKIYRTNHADMSSTTYDEDTGQHPPDEEDDEEDVQEVTDDEEGDEDGNDVMYEDEDQDDDDGGEDEYDDDDDVSVQTEEVEENFTTVKEAFAAGWKA